MNKPADRAKTVAVFGGAFDPPHVAHVLAVTYALCVPAVDTVLVVPVYHHPFAKKLAPFEERFAMCVDAMGWLPGVVVSDVERRLGGESLTLRTIEHLAGEHPEWALRLLIGADALVDAPKWHRFDRITELAPPLLLGRLGVSHDQAPEPLLPLVSSSRIRDAIAAGRPEEVRHLVPKLVLDRVIERGLYREEDDK